MQCHVAISHEIEVERAVHALYESTSQAFKQQSPDLAFLFFSSPFAEQAKTLQAGIQHTLSPRHLIGCMNNGVIGDAHEFEDQPTIVLWAALLPNVEISPLRLTSTEEGGQLSLQGWPESFPSQNTPPYFLLFADPFSTPIDDLFATIEKNYPGSLAIGGIASAGTDSGENRLMLNQEIYDHGVVGVALDGNIEVRTVVSQGCQPIGEPYVVTKADRNIVYELGGVSMLERLKAAIQDLRDQQKQQISQSIQVGLVMNEYRGHFERGDFLIRDLMGADEKTGGVAISDIVHEGQTLQFHVRDAEAANDELHKLLTDEKTVLSDRLPHGALLFSCNCRGQRFFSKPNHDISVLRDQIGPVPIAGFFAGGEIGPVGGKNYLHGYTASIALFYEPQGTE